MGTKTEVRPQKREAWGRLRKLPSKRWQARYVGPDDKVYSARTEDDKPLTFLTKGDARAWLNGVHAAISYRLVKPSDGVGPPLPPQRRGT